MKKLLIALVMISGLAIAPAAYGYLLSDWFGVTLVVGGDNQFTGASWTPTLHTSTVDYIHENWTPDGPPIPSPGDWGGGFGEQFDVEAIYFDNDDDYIYYAMVTSFHPDYLLPTELGYNHDRYIAPGDLAINMGGGMYEYGIDTGANTYGGTATGEVVQGGTWFLQNPAWDVSQPFLTNYYGGTSMGYASIDWYDLGMIENDYGTWVLELTIDRSYLGNPGNGDTVGLHWTLGCRNDYLGLIGDIDDHPPIPPIPEPTTLLLLGLGFGVAAAFKKFKA